MKYALFDDSVAHEFQTTFFYLCNVIIMLNTEH